MRAPSLRRGSLLATGLLVLASVVFAYPFVWMLLSIGKSNPEIFNPFHLWPRSWSLEPAHRLLSGEWFPFWRVLGNSLVVAGGQAVLGTLLTSLAGFAFASSRSRLAILLFPVALVLIVLPVQSLAVPLFSWINQLKLINHLAGVILPGAISGLGVIWFTQIFRQLPPSLREAARLDGAGEWRVWWTLLPVIKPAMLSFALIQFILAWHQHLLPMLVLNDQPTQTLPIAISSLYGSSLRYPYAALMAASIISVVPTALLFALGYRRFKTALADVLMH
ncbi:ABC transporter permease subunit [bacterium]|nr:ABC transporter permease subunit [bacterium]